MNEINSIFFNVRNTDEKEKIVGSLKCFNIIDIILKISALNLLPYNQNKSIIFDNIINDILTDKIDSYNSENIISMNKFRNLINLYMNSDIALSVDPAETPFIQRVQFYGDHWILAGINTNFGYILQRLIDVLFKHKNKFNKEFIDKCNRMTHFILTTTNYIVTGLRYGIDTLDHYEKKEVDIPSAKMLNDLSELLVVDVEVITKILHDEADILFYNSNNLSDFSEYKSNKNFSFFYSPLLKTKDNEAIILNPTMLPTFLVYYILKTSKKYDVFHEVINAYNNEVYNDCCKQIKHLGHKKIDAVAEGVELINNDSYKECIFTVSNNRLLFVRFFCDNGQNYNCTDMFGSFSFNSDPYNNRWEYIQKSFDKCDPENFYSLSIINTFGRGMFVGFSDKCTKRMNLSPFELECLSINEREHANFIARYLDSKSKLHKMPFSFGEMDSISQYTQNEYSFYYFDDINLNETFFIPDIGDAVDYFNKAIKKENRQLISFPHSHILKEIVLSSEERQIYYNSSPKSVEYVVRYLNVDIWVCGCEPTSLGEYNMVSSILDLITFWLSELKPIIEKLSFYYEAIVISNSINGEIKEYYNKDTNNDSSESDDLSFELNEEILTINWTQQAFHNLSEKDNSREKELMRDILLKLSPCYFGDLELKKIDKYFENPLKKKLFSIDISETPYIKPIYTKARKIPVEYTNELLDEIGQFALKTKQIPYGEISDSDKVPLCKDIVSFLYEKLKAEVACLDGIRLCELCYNDLEKVIYDALITHKRYSYDIVCYPEKAEEIFKSLSESNRVSLALKFLIEYVSATQPTGKEFFGEIEYENILTICSLIIEWANNGDMFSYKIINSKVQILKSQRIGIDKKPIERITSCQQQSYNKHLFSHSNPNIDTFSLESSADYVPDIDKAFIDEYGYSLFQLYAFVDTLLDVGDEIEPQVKIMKSDDVIDRIEKATDLSRDIIKSIIRDLSLVKRDDYIIPPDGFSNYDIWPWRFNRRLSFTRRPLIIYDDKLIWGNRQLSHSFWFTVDLIFDGKFIASGKKLSSLIGKIANKRGNSFNDDVKQKLKSINSITIDSKVKKINGKHISSSDNNPLGDIDILIINPKKNRIIVGEVKDFSFTKSSYEMYQEYRRVFCDNGSKLCYLSKHKKRVQWIKDHINDVIKHYNLPKVNWSVRDVLITNEVIVSNEIYHKNQNILLYSDINEKKILKI